MHIESAVLIKRGLFLLVSLFSSYKIIRFSVNCNLDYTLAISNKVDLERV